MDYRSPHLLIVCPEGADRVDLARRLGDLGYTPASAGDGVQGLAAARAQRPDLVLLHCGLNTPGAAPLLTELRGDRDLGDVPVIMLVPAGDANAMAEYYAQGADDYLPLPLSPTLLKVQVHDYLEIGRWRLEDRYRIERESLLKIERDVQIARQIQVGFLPNELPQPEGYQVAARFSPAREVAGDFYDAFTLTQGRRVGLVIADVCDKGVGAALFMALTRSLLRAFALQNYSLDLMDFITDGPAQPGHSRRGSLPSIGTTALRNAVVMTNEYITTNHAELNMFATLFFAMLDPVTGTLAYINGGHNPPFILDAQGHIRASLKPTGPAVGIMPGAQFKIGQACLEPGEVLMAYTDGVTDARNPGGTLFSEKRFCALLEQEPAAAADELAARVEEALRAHIADAPQFDDITMMVLRRLPAATP